MVVGDLRRGLKGTIVMGGADVGGHRGPLFFCVLLGKGLKRIYWGIPPNPNFSFSLAQRKEVKETSTLTKPLPIWRGCN